MQVQLKSIEETQTWDSVERPIDKKCKPRKMGLQKWE